MSLHETLSWVVLLHKPREIMVSAVVHVCSLHVYLGFFTFQSLLSTKLNFPDHLAAWNFAAMGC